MSLGMLTTILLSSTHVALETCLTAPMLSINLTMPAALGWKARPDIDIQRDPLPGSLVWIIAGTVPNALGQSRLATETMRALRRKIP